VISQINERNEELKKLRSSFYDGGYSFEHCHKMEIDDLVDLQNELKELLKIINI
jgi:hypothetical protein